MTFELTPAQVASGFALSGQRPSAGQFATLPPVASDQAVELLADTGVLKGKKLTKEAVTIFGLLAAPGRKITSTVVTPLAEGTAISTFYGPAEGGPYVALAETETGYQFGLVESGADVAAIVSGYLGLGGDPEPLHGDAVELPASAWAMLGALADLDERSSLPGAVRRALSRRPGKIVEVFRTIAPAGAADPGSAGLKEAGNWLVGDGLVVRMHDNKLQPTRSGRAVLRALRRYVAAGSISVDHLSEAGPVRAVSLSSIRTTERLFFGAWKVGEHGPVIALGEPGAPAAATMIRTLIESPNVLPVAAAAVAGAPIAAAAPAPPPPPAPPSAPTPVWKLEPRWLTYLIGAGLALALVGAGIGLFGDDDSALAGPDTDVVATTVAVTTTIAPTTTTTAAPTTTVAVPQTIPPGIIESSTTSSTTSTSTTTTSTTTTTTLPAAIIDENFDGSDTAAAPLFGPGVMTSEVNNIITGDVANGVLEMTVFVGGFIPSMYPDPLPDNVEISFNFNPQPASNGTAFGAVLLSEDPSDGALDHYVALFVTPVNGLATMLPWDGAFGAPQNVTIPAEAGFATNEWNSLRFVLVGGQIDVYINDVFVMTWNGVTPVTSGHWGPLIVGAVSGDAMLVDNVLVEDL